MLLKALAFLMLSSVAAEDIPQGSTWTRKYVGAKEICKPLDGYKFTTMSSAQQTCHNMSSCSGVYDPACNNQTFRLCDKYSPFTSAAGIVFGEYDRCVYRKPVAQQCKWGAKVRGSIKSANVHRYKGLTLSECKLKCEANDLCKSIDFAEGGSNNGDCNLGNCRMGEGCSNEHGHRNEKLFAGDKNWIHYSCPKPTTDCHNNRLSIGVEIRGNDLELNSLVAPWHMTSASSLRLLFPECEWDQKQVKRTHWEMKNCKCGGAPCNQCGYAELCSEICSHAKACKHVTFWGNECQPKSSSGFTLFGSSTKDRRAVSNHSSVSGPPAPSCFKWTRVGVEYVYKNKKTEEYGMRPQLKKLPEGEWDLRDDPNVNTPVSAKVQEIWSTTKYIETALKGGMIYKVGCVIEGQITNRATFVQPLWVAFIAVSCAVMQ